MGAFFRGVVTVFFAVLFLCGALLCLDGVAGSGDPLRLIAGSVIVFGSMGCGALMEICWRLEHLAELQAGTNRPAEKRPPGTSPRPVRRAEPAAAEDWGNHRIELSATEAAAAAHGGSHTAAPPRPKNGDRTAAKSPASADVFEAAIAADLAAPPPLPAGPELRLR